MGGGHNEGIVGVFCTVGRVQEGLVELASLDSTIIEPCYGLRELCDIFNAKRCWRSSAGLDPWAANHFLGGTNKPLLHWYTLSELP